MIFNGLVKVVIADNVFKKCTIRYRRVFLQLIFQYFLPIIHITQVFEIQILFRVHSQFQIIRVTQLGVADCIKAMSVKVRDAPPPSKGNRQTASNINIS